MKVISWCFTGRGLPQKEPLVLHDQGEVTTDPFKINDVHLLMTTSI